MYFQLPTEHYSVRLLSFLGLFFKWVLIFLPFVSLRVFRVPGSHLVLGILIKKYYSDIFCENNYI